MQREARSPPARAQPGSAPCPRAAPRWSPAPAIAAGRPRSRGCSRAASPSCTRERAWGWGPRPARPTHPWVAAGGHQEGGTVSSEPRKAALPGKPHPCHHSLYGRGSPLPPGSIWAAVRDFHGEGNRILSAEVQQPCTLILAASPIHERCQDSLS